MVGSAIARQRPANPGDRQHDRRLTYFTQEFTFGNQKRESYGVSREPPHPPLDCRLALISTKRQPGMITL